MSRITETDAFGESPRSVADKSSKTALLAAIRMALRIEGPAVRHNTQTFNRNRYTATAALSDYEALKDRAREIKEKAIENLPELLATLEASVQRNGGHYYFAADAQVATRYIREVCQRAGVRLVVKGKSMTSEEAGLNHVLEEAGIEVAETDLAEFILQVADEQPSHIVGPALHYSRERITALFKNKFQTDLPLDTGEELTAFARQHLRQKFLRADAGITGANLVAADSGTLMLVESEGNIRMASYLPPLHIAITGVEKIVPSRQDLAPFLELLAASATGQPLTCYTSLIRPPLGDAPVVSDGAAPPREFHLVVMDNGRMKMRQDAVLREALYCVRCGACLNSCANFQTVGGHAFGGQTYSGGIGGSWEAGTRGLQYARFSELCTGCSRCVPQCPVRIEIPWLNTNLRQRLSAKEASGSSRLRDALLPGMSGDDRGASLQKVFFGRYDLVGKWGARTASLTNWVSRWLVMRAALEKVFGLDQRRALPPFASETLVQAARKLARAANLGKKGEPQGKAVLFADVFTNYGSPQRGLAALQVLRALGVDVVVSESLADGRAALSQGLIATAAQQAEKTAALLCRYLDEGREVIVVEPSVLTMYRLDYHHLLESARGQERLERLRAGCYDAAEYVWKILRERHLDAAQVFSVARSPFGLRVFYHAHCQQETIGCAAPTETLLRAAGFDVATSEVECCGMAGSFGYKKDFYELSMAVGEDLFEQVRKADAEGERLLIASGTSCQEQLQAGLGRPVLHPMELLARIVGPSLSPLP
jgi:iron-sulfur cluster protein